MPRIRITGWKPGLLKVSHTQTLRQYAGMSLSDAKAATDRVLDGRMVEFAVADQAEADAMVTRLQLLGAVAQCASDWLGLGNAHDAS